MRFVPIKTKEQQTDLMLHRARQLLVRQRTMLSNALRGHLAELGVVSAKGRNGTAELLRIIADGRVSSAVCSILKVLAWQYDVIGTEIAAIDKSIMVLHRGCEASPPSASNQRYAETNAWRPVEFLKVSRAIAPIDSRFGRHWSVDFAGRRWRTDGMNRSTLKNQRRVVGRSFRFAVKELVRRTRRRKLKKLDESTRQCVVIERNGRKHYTPKATGATQLQCAAFEDVRAEGEAARA